MKTDVRDTSIEAYHGLHLAPLQAKIVAFMSHYGRAFTRGEIAALSGIPINSVAGRVKELIDAGVIVEGAPRVCKFSGRSAHSLTVAPKQMEMEMVA